jgi:hypothetical protein
MLHLNHLPSEEENSLGAIKENAFKQAIFAIFPVLFNN